ncbi:MAG: hypothetical protein QQN63_03970 [Nitrosopumilus sp.]
MSDKTEKGVVTRLYEKDWTDRDSGDQIILHSFQIEGNKRYFRTGTKVPPFSEGDSISFVADSQSNNVDLKSVKQVEVETVTAPKPTASPKSSGSATSRDEYWANKEKNDVEVLRPTIAYSAAQKNATALVAAALAADALSFGSTAKGKRLDMLVDFVELTTLRLASLQTDAPALLKGYEPMAKAEKVVDDE